MTRQRLSRQVNGRTTKVDRLDNLWRARLPSGRTRAPGPHALVAQWIEHAPPKRGMQVRFLPGAWEGEPQWQQLPFKAALILSLVLVSESTLEAAAVPEPKVSELPPQRRARIPAPIRRHPWWIGSACLVVFSFLLIRWAGTRPGYDPYGWMIWGYQTLHLNLDLGGAPSWKPLTWLFDVPFALFGRANLWLWMTTSVSIALAGSIFAGRVSYRLSRLAGVEHTNALVAGVFAGLCLLGIEDYFHYLLSVQSDPMIVTLLPRRDRLPPLRPLPLGAWRSVCSPRSAGPRPGPGSGSTGSGCGASSRLCAG